VARPHGTKLRTFTVSGAPPDELPSRSRPHKPPAKELSARKAAALSSGGGRLPPKIREKLDQDAMRVRVHPAKPIRRTPTRTRSGKRELPSRRGGNRAPDPGTRRASEARKAPRH